MSQGRFDRFFAERRCTRSSASTVIANNLWRADDRLVKRADSSPELFLVEASPHPRTSSRKSREHTREMTLIGKATSEGHVRQRVLLAAQEQHGVLNTPM